MPIDNITVNQGYQLPHPENSTEHDVERLIAALTAIDIDIATIIGGLLLRAAIDSPEFTGTPKAPTQPAGTNDNTVATTGHVQLALEAFLTQAANALQIIADLEAALGEGDLAETLTTLIAGKAPIASPALTGTPTAPTPDVETSSDRLATTAFVYAVKALVLGAVGPEFDTLQKLAAAIGGDANFAATVAAALADKAPLSSPGLTGNPTAPTQTAGNNSTRIANTAFVQAAINLLNTSVQSALALKAPLASPALTGTPTAPTKANGDNTTALATTAFVQSAITLLSTAIQSALNAKAPLASPALTGNPTAPTQAAGNNSTRIANTAFVKAAIDAIDDLHPTFTSGQFTMTAGGLLTAAHGLGGVPTQVEAYAVCVTANNGWAVGDIVKVGDTPTYGTVWYGLIVWADATNVYARLSDTGSIMLVVNKSTGTGVPSGPSLNANWKLILRAKK